MRLLLAASLLAGSSASSAATEPVSTVVARLGTPASPFHDFDLLDRNRCTALPLIVTSLERLPAVPPGKVGGDLGRPEDRLTLRTSGLLRALRILTNHDEYGPLSAHDYTRLPVYSELPGSSSVLQRDALIRGLPAGRSRYYGYWISHGTSFYAPAATQRAIKARWKTYIAGFNCHAVLPGHRWQASFFNG